MFVRLPTLRSELRQRNQAVSWDNSKHLSDCSTHFKELKDGKIISEGYAIEKQIDGKRYRSKISSKNLSMEEKLNLAIKKLKSFELEAKKNVL